MESTYVNFCTRYVLNISILFLDFLMRFSICTKGSSVIAVNICLQIWQLNYQLSYLFMLK